MHTDIMQFSKPRTLGILWTGISILL